MKKIFLLPILVLFFASTSWALTIEPSTYVGTVDRFIDSTNLGNSGDADEEAWVQEVLEDDSYILTSKTDTPNPSAVWHQTIENSDAYAFDFVTDSPEYFLVKTGNNDGTTDTHFLYQNLDSVDWAVIDINVVSITNIGKLSHIDEFSPVPEPATIFLLGIGLSGLVFAGRKKILAKR